MKYSLQITVVLALAITMPAFVQADEYYKYDASGNLEMRRIGDQVLEMKFDRANQIKVMDMGASKIQFEYDSAGAVIGEQVANARGKGKSIEVVEYRRGYLSRVREVIRKDRKIKIYYNHTGFPAGKQIDSKVEPWVWSGSKMILGGDQLFSPELGTKDYLGSDLSSNDSESPFGEKREGQSYTGKYYDQDLGAYVFPYRFYRPDMARWMEADPSGFPDGPNQYAYSSNPAGETDPLGLDLVSGTTTGGNGAVGYTVASSNPLVIRPLDAGTSRHNSGTPFANSPDGGAYQTTGALDDGFNCYHADIQIEASYDSYTANIAYMNGGTYDDNVTMGGTSYTMHLIVDQTFSDNILQHEQGHRALDNAFGALLEAVAAWSEGYVSNDFSDPSEVPVDSEDIEAAINSVSLWTKLNNRHLTHPGFSATYGGRQGNTFTWSGFTTSNPDWADSQVLLYQTELAGLDFNGMRKEGEDCDSE